MDKKLIMQNKKDVVITASSSPKTNKLKELVNLFNDNKDQYTSNNYDEAKTRTDFIDKFFELLDWDVRNEQGFAEAYRDVIREDKVRIEGKQKAPDYCFKIGVERKFFVEAKKPSVNIKDDIGAAYQLRRYAYSAKLPLSILTDFHEFAVYDTRIKPKPKDNASVARIFYCRFDEYENNFDFIFNTFSKNAILKGSFDRYVATSKNKKGTSEVDKEFLKLIESWRNELAKNIASNNRKLDLYNLNSAVQKIIDRIIFLRIAEDRNIEEYNSLSKISRDGNVYKKLDEYFKQSDARYNSGLFHIEDWLSELKIDDKILKDIIKSTYYPESPYEFSVLPVEILGNIYEQFLGKVIHLTSSHQAKIEEKPEVKKAGGVYYTPKYIVEYIVKNTVGEKIKDSTPEKIEKIKICDPACGSGSFLLGAYSYLLHWHLNYYADPKRLKESAKKGKIYHYASGDFKLTIEEKKNILLNNIFGVDIDGQAVEVTKLSLLLKLMEDETQESAGMLIKYNQGALLPNLQNNIKCGNSLIGSDFYEDKNMSLFGNEEMRKVNVFDWQKQFSNIFNDGGFDIVIGNPPYVDYRVLDNKQLDYINSKYYSSKVKGKWNLYILFIELGTKILHKNGLFGYIIPNAFLVSEFGLNIRKLLLNNTNIYKLIDVSRLKVFGSVATYPVLLFFKNSKVNDTIEICYVNDNENLSNAKCNKIKQKDFLKPEDNYIIPTTTNSINTGIIKNIQNGTTKLGDLCENFVWGTSITGFKKLKISQADYNKLKTAEKDNYEKVIQTSDIKRYHIAWGGEYIKKSIYSSNVVNLFNKDKIVIARVTKTIQATYDTEKYYVGKSSLLVNLKVNPYYLLGLLNSRLLNYFYYSKYENTHMAGGYLRFDIPYLKTLPIHIIKKEEKSYEEKIIKLVRNLLEIKNNFYSAKTDADKSLYQQKIEIIDKQIDGEVYKLYGLTDEEIKIIEEK